MGNLNFSRNIARLRGAAKLTQEGLAAHVGVTKAAVSKWEVGAGYPDMEMLPRLASFFRVTVDDLLGYEPQMAPSEIERTTRELLAAVAADPDGVRARATALAADYASCWELLLNLASVHAMLAACNGGDGSDLDAARELADRVAAFCPEGPLIAKAAQCKAMWLSAVGDVKGAIAVLEGLNLANGFPAQTMLAALYCWDGAPDAALGIYRRELYAGSKSAMACITSALQITSDEALVRELLRAGDGLMEGFGLAARRTLDATTYLAAAIPARISLGCKAKAIADMRLLADFLEDDVPAGGDNETALFRGVAGSGADEGLGGPMASMLDAVGLRRQCAQMAVASPAVQVALSDPEIAAAAQPLIEIAEEEPCC